MMLHEDSEVTMWGMSHENRPGEGCVVRRGVVRYNVGHLLESSLWCGTM